MPGTTVRGLFVRKDNKVYVIGHKNPDTDSICSAIAYADIKNRTTKGTYVAKRAGQINEETEFVLKYFHVPAPGYLPDVGTQVKDMDLHETPGAANSMSVKRAWDKLRQLKEDKTVLNVTVKGIVSAGVIAYVEGIRGFIPASKLSLNYVEDLNEYLNKEIQVQVFDVEEEDNRLILSARELLREKAEEERRAKVSNVEVGLVTEGTVESLQPYGAFVNLGNGLSGLVHISQISEKRIKHPSAVLAVGDKVKVKVIAVKDGKLSLSMKALQDVAAQEIEEEVYELPETEEATTTLGSLFANIKLS